MKAAYVYYAMERKAASTKQMLKTCEALGEEVNLTLYSTLGDIDDVLDFYGAEKSFDYSKKGFKENESVVFEAFKRLYFSLKTYFVIRREDFDAVYTPDVAFLSMMRLLPSETSVFYESHNPYDDSYKIPTFLEEAALELPEKTFCVSEGVQNSLTEKGVEADRLEVLRNGVDSVYLSEEENYEENERFEILYVGSFKERKGVDVLVDAFQHLEEKFELTLVGGRDANKDLLEKIRLDDAISFRGRVPEKQLPGLMQSADVLVLPSNDTKYQRKFTSPMKLFEYLASGTPVVASELPTTREIAGDTVFYFKPGNPEALASQIKNAVDEDEDKAAAVRRAEEFTWEERARRIKEVVEERT